LEELIEKKIGSKKKIEFTLDTLYFKKESLFKDFQSNIKKLFFVYSYNRNSVDMLETDEMEF